jgi:hypothetical protein
MKVTLRITNLTIVCILLANAGSKAQSANADSSFYGTWKGTSICQIKNSPCHDETVVFYVSKSAKENLIELKGNKIVNGVEEEMGIIDFRYDPVSKEIVSVSQPDAIWKFRKNKNSMSGTLTYNGQLSRIVNLTRQN